MKYFQIYDKHDLMIMSTNPISRLLPSSSASSNQDTMSKLLPQVPDMDTQLQLAAKMIDKKTATHKVRNLYSSSKVNSCYFYRVSKKNTLLL